MKYIKKFETKGRQQRSPNPSSVQFKKYILEFYGKKGIYPETFPGGLTTKTINKYLDEFIQKLQNRRQFYGDSMDREFFRDYLLFKLGYRKINELEMNIRFLLNDFEIKTDKFNL